VTNQRNGVVGCPKPGSQGRGGPGSLQCEVHCWVSRRTRVKLKEKRGKGRLGGRTREGGDGLAGRLRSGWHGLGKGELGWRKG